MLLQNLIKLTPNEHVDYHNLSEARDAVATVNQYINNRQNIELLQQRESTINKDEITSGFLKIEAVEAKFDRVYDSFVRIIYGNTRFDTSVIRKDQTPKWNKEFVLDLYPGCPEIFSLLIYEKNIVEKPICELEFPLKTFERCKDKLDEWFTFLSLRSSKKSHLEEGKMHLIFQYYRNKL